MAGKRDTNFRAGKKPQRTDMFVDASHDSALYRCTVNENYLLFETEFDNRL